MQKQEKQKIQIKGGYLLHETTPEQFSQLLDKYKELQIYLEHICIDKDPAADALLKLKVAQHKLTDEQLDNMKIYGYLITPEDPEGREYLFVLEEVHKLIQQKFSTNQNICST